MIVLMCLTCWFRLGFSRFLPFADLYGTSSWHLCFLSTKKRMRCDEKHGNNTNTKRQAHFKIHARFLICSLDHLFQAQLSSWKRMENFDRNYSSRIFIKRAWLWVQFQRKIIQNKWKSINQCQFWFIGNAIRCIHIRYVIPFTVIPYKSASIIQEH